MDACSYIYDVNGFIKIMASVYTVSTPNGLASFLGIAEYQGSQLVASIAKH